jgi:hypothetical protein
MGHRPVPRGTPDPDGDRRFAEREFPLLEPLDWNGERHRGGYGTSEPGSTTIALGLVFGPWDAYTSQPRLAVTVGSCLPIEVTDEAAPFLFRGHFIADREMLASPDVWPRPVRSKDTVEIEGTRVELHAVPIEPGDVRLRVAGELPDR